MDINVLEKNNASIFRVKYCSIPLSVRIKSISRDIGFGHINRFAYLVAKLFLTKSISAIMQAGDPLFENLVPEKWTVK
jgi:hypothetical protein